MYYRDTKIETCPEEPNRISVACFIICTEDNECPIGQKGCGEVGWAGGEQVTCCGWRESPLSSSQSQRNTPALSTQKSAEVLGKVFAWRRAKETRYTATVGVARSAHQPLRKVGGEPYLISSAQWEYVLGPAQPSPKCVK